MIKTLNKWFVNDTLPKECPLPFFNVENGSSVFYLSQEGLICQKQIEGRSFVVPLLLNVSLDQIITWSSKLLHIKSSLSKNYIGCYVDGGDDRGRNKLLYIKRK